MSLHPDFPVVEGPHPLTPEWTIALAEPFNRRIEEGDLVLWRPDVTAWIAIWHNDEGASIALRLDDLKQHMSAEAYDIEQEQVGGTLYFSYRLAEEPEPGQEPREPGFYSYVFADDSHVQMAVYIDDEDDAGAARALHRSLVHAPAA